MATNNSVNTGLAGASGTGAFAGNVSPSFTTPALGTPSAGVLSSCTGYAQSALTGLGTGVSTFLGTPSSANLAAAVTDETGSGALVFANTPTLVTPVLGAASATSVTFSTTTGIVGTTTNNNAAAGSVGEYISSSVDSGTPVSATSGAAFNVTSISLTAGDWDVWGTVGSVPNAATTTTNMFCWISTTSASFTGPPNSGGANTWQLPVAAGVGLYLTMPHFRVPLGSTTTVYLSALITFAVNTNAGYGFIGARRRR